MITVLNDKRARKVYYFFRFLGGSSSHFSPAAVHLEHGFDSTASHRTRRALHNRQAILRRTRCRCCCCCGGGGDVGVVGDDVSAIAADCEDSLTRERHDEREWGVSVIRLKGNETRICLTTTSRWLMASGAKRRCEYHKPMGKRALWQGVSQLAT